MFEWLYVLNILTITLIMVVIFIVSMRTKKTKLGSDLSYVIVDTSALIDGRILEVCNSGFVNHKLLVAEFVIKELQKVADSSDSLRRQKGRDGLKTLRAIQKIDDMSIEIVDEDYPEISYVDEKIIALSKEKKAKILTVDYNLNNVAKVHQISVLNINELAKNLRPLFLPGEELEIKIIQKGKEENQGIGYLEDGTMVVVEDGRKFMGHKLKLLVSRILQTDAGRMVFARPKAYGLDRVGAPKQFIRLPSILPWQRRRNDSKKNYFYRENNHNNHTDNNDLNNKIKKSSK